MTNYYLLYFYIIYQDIRISPNNAILKFVIIIYILLQTLKNRHPPKKLPCPQPYLPLPRRFHFSPVLLRVAPLPPLSRPQHPLYLAGPDLSLVIQSLQAKLPPQMPRPASHSGLPHQVTSIYVCVNKSMTSMNRFYKSNLIRNCNLIISVTFWR